MLLIAAALLTASMHSLGVVEAPVAPALSTVTVVASTSTTHNVTSPATTNGIAASNGTAATTATAPASAAAAVTSAAAAADTARPADTAAPAGAAAPTDTAAAPGTTTVAATVADTAAASGRSFLVDLSSLNGPELERADRNRAIVATAQDDPPAAAEVTSWWSGLDEDERQLLVTSAPTVIGNLDGVPYIVRDQANRAVLAAGLADDHTSAAGAAMLGQVRDSLTPEAGAPERYLITLDTRGSGRAAIAIGDLATAADVTVVVPGMFFTVTGQMPDFTNTANDLYSEQATLAGLAAPSPGSGVAVVAWMGYRTPDLSNILSLSLAESGAERLERTVGALREIRTGDEPRVNIVAHSYGSTTAMTALSSGRMHADSLTVFGSPGSPVRSAKELAVPAGAVFVGDAHSDPIAGSGYFGTDPGSASFGSTLLDLAGGVAAQTAGDVFRRPVGHNDYLKPGTASLHDVALIAVGRGDLVRDEVRRGEGGGDDVPQASPDMYLVRPQDLQQRD